jgi:mRNA interferase RelE/StbE
VDNSSEYRIFETDEFTRRLAKFSITDAKSIRTKLQKYAYPQLREQPFYGANIRKLRGFSTDVWRYRIGRFRVFYTVDENDRVVSIVSLEARKDAYR